MSFKYLRIGKIVNTQGIKGEVRVIPLTEDITRFESLKYVYLDDTRLEKLYIEGIRYHKNFVIIKFRGFDTMNDGEKLKDNYILVDRENTIKLREGSYFVCDMIGVSVYDEKLGYLGSITDILNTGSNDVYVVRDDEKEVLVPALKTVVKSIDIGQGKILVDLPEGLI